MVLLTGECWQMKVELILCVRSVAEYLRRAEMHLERNNSAVQCTCTDTCSTGETFILEASYVARRDCWIYCFSEISGRNDQRLSGEGSVTEYHERKFANKLCEQLKTSPTDQDQLLRASLKPYIKFHDDLEDNGVSRARTTAVQNIFVRQGENMRRLTAMKHELERRRHLFGFTTIDGTSIRTVLRAVVKADQASKRKNEKILLAFARRLRSRPAGHGIQWGRMPGKTKMLPTL